MKKEEVLLLGVPEDKYREFQALYNRDLRKAVSNSMEKAGQVMPGLLSRADDVRKAILSMLRMIDDPVRLDFILRQTMTQYNYQTREKNRGGKQFGGENQNQL